MFALCTAVTLRRPLSIAHWKPKRNTRCVPKIDAGLMLRIHRICDARGKLIEILQDAREQLIPRFQVAANLSTLNRGRNILALGKHVLAPARRVDCRVQRNAGPPDHQRGA